MLCALREALTFSGPLVLGDEGKPLASWSTLSVCTGPCSMPGVALPGPVPAPGSWSLPPHPPPQRFKTRGWASGQGGRDLTVLVLYFYLLYPAQRFLHMLSPGAPAAQWGVQMVPPHFQEWVLRQERKVMCRAHSGGP